MDTDPWGSELIGDTGEGIICPAPCAHCDGMGPGSCGDCLDCLVWPEVVPPRDATPLPALPGRTSPTMTEALRARRTTLVIGARVGLVSRRFRRRQGLSQRGLAHRIGWSQSSVNRAERDAGPLTVDRLESYLGHLGYRLAIVPTDTHAAGADTTEPVAATVLGEDPDEAWGAVDLLAHDSRNRRLPATGEVTWHSVIDRRLRAGSVKHENEWSWHHPPPRTARRRPD